MPGSGHGGKRVGAGRKETIDYMSQLHVGARAQNFQAKITRRKAMAEFDLAMARCGVREAQAKARAILNTEGLNHWKSSFEGEDTREALGFSLASYHGLSDERDPLNEIEPEDVPRGVSLSWSSYDTREYVQTVIARWASWYYGVTITRRRVRDCWAEYRRFLRQS